MLFYLHDDVSFMRQRLVFPSSGTGHGAITARSVVLVNVTRIHRRTPGRRNNIAPIVAVRYDAVVRHRRAVNNHGQMVEHYGEVVSAEQEERDDMVTAWVPEGTEYLVHVHRDVSPHVSVVTAVNNRSYEQRLDSKWMRSRDKVFKVF